MALREKNGNLLNMKLKCRDDKNPKNPNWKQLGFLYYKSMNFFIYLLIKCRIYGIII